MMAMIAGLYMVHRTPTNIHRCNRPVLQYSGLTSCSLVSIPGIDDRHSAVTIINVTVGLFYVRYRWNSFYGRSESLFRVAESFCFPSTPYRSSRPRGPVIMVIACITRDKVNIGLVDGRIQCAVYIVVVVVTFLCACISCGPI